MHPPQLAAFLLPLLVAPVAGSASLSCENIQVDGHSFDLSKLGGPHSVVTTRYDPNPPEHFNTTYTVDICKPLKKSGKSKKGQECPADTRVCAITHLLQDETDTIMEVVSIAGDLEEAGGTPFNYTATRLKTSDADSQKEGLRLVLNGGKHPLAKDGQEQQAVIEFICDRNKTGTEGEWESEDKYEKSSKLRLRDEEKSEDETKEGDNKDNSDDGSKEADKDGDKGSDDGEGESITEHQLKKEGAALIWNSYELEKDVKVLRMTWYTEYACEKRDDGGDDGDLSGAHWGFFTWFIIIAFLGIAAYLVFSSWLNYNRYGARGWDLLPHSDTIRDVPYLMKDWLRRVLNTVQGTGSRGGYSAV